MQNQNKYPFAVVLVLDGWGYAPFSQYNAIKLAKTPNIDKLKGISVSGLLAASGEAVGLPKGIIGNSEVGHLHIGAGRQVPQEVLVINNEIKNGQFFKNPVIIEALEHARNNESNIHFIGLVSDALVHSSIDHLFALMKLASDLGLGNKVFIHAITDGRDTPPDSSYKYINEISERINMYKSGRIATVHGRYYAMDRDERWDRIEKSYETLTSTVFTGKIYDNAIDGINNNYSSGKTDEFIEPFRLKLGNDINEGNIKENDTVIFFNFREDRARQLTKALSSPIFTEFKRDVEVKCMVSMTEYEKGLTKRIAYEKAIVEQPMSFVFAESSIPQFKVAETEKYAHVTYFFNGGREVPFPLEDRYIIPSLKIPTYDLKPFMRSKEIADNLIERIDSKKYGLLVANFANADMVGHSGNLEATIKACEYVDDAVGKVLNAVLKNGGILFVTADHGNAEIKYDEVHKIISTSHTTSPVPIYITGENISPRKIMETGTLADIAPTLLNAVGLERSIYMTGNNLLE